ncbi:uncharacterized protein ColSpa_01632 [Colletotrichum spaethianum]|uniref:Uncharacterized protein n=1 Tax=Colletotrichum spaethianum TaxID=700344 RepID=A0AA37P4K6_9PEZI|nr:uncharacterized protein ColSpa_01632 [Colletotrichum spaethianum]GKT41451.1 hypothetical protein ColSpa_01632 [Colletotrichum spaethianum]
MYLSTTAVLAIAASMVAANPIDVRAANVVDNVSGLYDQIRGHTAVINSTVAGINSKSTSSQKATAKALISTQTNNIIAAIEAAKSGAAGGQGLQLSAGNQQQIINDMSQIVFELQGAYGGINKQFGDSYGNGLLLNVFGPLNGLLQDLGGIVVGLVSIVGGVVAGVFGAVGGVLGLLLQILFGFSTPFGH